VKKILFVVFLFLLFALAAYSQEQTVIQSKTDESLMMKPEPQGQVTHRQLFRPSDFNNLKEYVEKTMEGKFNPSTLETGISADGYPKV
jgi:hypothetical protein